jgi:type IV secretory pathway TrbL component
LNSLYGLISQLYHARSTNEFIEALVKKSLALFVISMSLSACVTDSDTYLPDGSLGHHVTCGGAIFSMGDCVQKAGQICGAAGYKVIGANGEATPYSTSSGGFSANATSAAGGYSSSSGSIVNRDLFIKCN